MNFPDVTAFLIAGILIGPSCLGRLGIEGLGFVSYHAVEEISVISTAALGFIAFSIGSEFKLSALRKTGKAAAVIGIVQAVNATILVDAALMALHFVLGDAILPAEAAITLGAIASATAPAATLMVVRQYKADGPLTRLLLPIVALYVAFFVLSGAELELGVFRRREYVLIGIVFILIRSAGKYLGAYVSSGIMNCDRNVRKYLGITLLPQAGVALGMCSQAMELGEDIGSVIRNVTLFGVMIYELAGPFMTKEALKKAGEIKTKPAVKQSRERFRKA